MPDDLLSIILRLLGRQKVGKRRSEKRNPSPRTDSTTKKSKPAETQSASQRQMISQAQKLQGTGYKYGGNNPQEGFDCSGLIHYVFAGEGIEVPRVSRLIAAHGLAKNRRQAQPGDIAYFGETEANVNHVGILTSIQPLKMITPAVLKVSLRPISMLPLIGQVVLSGFEE